MYGYNDEYVKLTREDFHGLLIMAGNKQGCISTCVTNPVVRHVASMLAERHHKCYIKESLEADMEVEFGVRTWEEVFKRARELLRSRRDTDLNVSFNEAIEWYSMQIRDRKNGIQFRIRCQERLDLLLGHERIGEGGMPLEERARRAIELLQGDIGGVLSSDSNAEFDTKMD